MLLSFLKNVCQEGGSPLPRWKPGGHRSQEAYLLARKYMLGGGGHHRIVVSAMLVGRMRVALIALYGCGICNATGPFQETVAVLGFPIMYESKGGKTALRKHDQRRGDSFIIITSPNIINQHQKSCIKSFLGKEIWTPRKCVF